MHIVLYILSIIIIIGTFLPFLDNKHWFIRGQANFRVEYLALNLLLIVLLTMYSSFDLSIALIFLHLLGTIICIKSIYPYLPFAPKPIKNAKVQDQPLKLLINNVYQFNTEYDKLIQLILKEDPDIILLLETNVDWDEKIQKLKPIYKYVVKEIRSDTYGIMMLSKHQPEENTINYLVSESIPSTEMLLKLYNRSIRILGIHPKPPIPGEALTSLPKDKEILTSANYIDSIDEKELYILIGDLNDVAWSKTANKFNEITGLEDPRKGRGFYSTFPTYLPIMIPLDHTFCSTEFEMINFRTGSNIGSDHLPVIITLQVP